MEVSISAIWTNYNGPSTILTSQNLLTWQLPSPSAREKRPQFTGRWSLETLSTNS